MKKLTKTLPWDERELYSYVPIERGEIRLLLLSPPSPGHHDDKIYCSLKRYLSRGYCRRDSYFTPFRIAGETVIPPT
jgi:hypothetical protein